MNFKLTESINAHGETINELEIVINVKLLMKLDLPYSLNESCVPQPIAGKIAEYISQGAKIPMSSVEQICIQDFNKIMWDIVGFLTQMESGKKEVLGN